MFPHNQNSGNIPHRRMLTPTELNDLALEFERQQQQQQASAYWLASRLPMGHYAQSVIHPPPQLLPQPMFSYPMNPYLQELPRTHLWPPVTMLHHNQSILPPLPQAVPVQRERPNPSLMPRMPLGHVNPELLQREHLQRLHSPGKICQPARLEFYRESPPVKIIKILNTAAVDQEANIEPAVELLLEQLEERALSNSGEQEVVEIAEFGQPQATSPQTTEVAHGSPDAPQFETQLNHAPEANSEGEELGYEDGADQTMNKAGPSNALVEPLEPIPKVPKNRLFVNRSYISAFYDLERLGAPESDWLNCCRYCIWHGSAKTVHEGESEQCRYRNCGERCCRDGCPEIAVIVQLYKKRKIALTGRQLTELRTDKKGPVTISAPRLRFQPREEASPIKRVSSLYRQVRPPDTTPSSSSGFPSPNLVASTSAASAPMVATSPIPAAPRPEEPLHVPQQTAEGPADVLATGKKIKLCQKCSHHGQSNRMTKVHECPFQNCPCKHCLKTHKARDTSRKHSEKKKKKKL